MAFSGTKLSKIEQNIIENELREIKLNILDRVAVYNGHDNWNSLVNSITKKKIKFSIPNYMHYNNTNLIHNTILNSIKESNLILTMNKNENGLLIHKK